MTIISTDGLRPETLNIDQVQQIYNGLDSLITLEVFESLSGTYGDPSQNHIYQFEKALQGPYLDIMQRGFAVDQMARHQAAVELRKRIDSLSATLNEFAVAVWKKTINPRSPTQLKEFFYKAMSLPEIWLSFKGERKLSTNREALEKLEKYLYARPFVNCILTIRDLAKQLEVFETEIDSDGRFRASYNIAGTETGRPSSSENAFGTGGNAQNIAQGLRYVFVADQGYVIVVVDLEQVEARDVGYFCGCLFNDWAFLDACESGDLHANNAKRIWPELPWTGDPKADRAIANQIFYREFTYRDMAKRGSHLSNYMGTSWTAARALKVPLQIMDDFQFRYCRGESCAYPAIARWWQWTAEQLQMTRTLITPFGRKRQFFGRPGDDATLREAIAFMPQSTTADRMNLGLLKAWSKMPQVQFLAQTYDSITFQFRQELNADDIISEVLEHINVELQAPNGRRYAVPGEAKIGYNWGARVTRDDIAKAIAEGRKPPRLNVDGLVKFKPGMTLPPRTSSFAKLVA